MCVAKSPDNKSLLEPVIKIDTFSLYLTLNELITLSHISTFCISSKKGSILNHQ